jgi:ribosomal protein S18 acetylase RimI-like enzyme
MKRPDVRTAKEADRRRVMCTLQLAFVADPMMRWVFPSATDFVEVIPDFFDAFGGAAFAHGTADLANDGQAAALWLPPGVNPDVERMFALILERGAAPEEDEDRPIHEQMARFHPQDPYWYLAIIGADPACTGQGLGAALLESGLQRCDEAAQVAYLESSNRRNVSLYQRHGFEIMGEIQSGASPVMFPMIRYPR